jgi:hypothetical protein
MEKRRIGRLTDNLDAELISGEVNYSGIIMNFSEDGLNMVTATANNEVDIMPSTVLELNCKLPSGEKVSLSCEVKWFQTKNSPHGISFSVGMEILNPPLPYKEFIETLR